MELGAPMVPARYRCQRLHGTIAHAVLSIPVAGLLMLAWQSWRHQVRLPGLRLDLNMAF